MGRNTHNKPLLATHQSHKEKVNCE